MRSVWRITLVVVLAAAAGIWAVLALQDRTAIATVGCGPAVAPTPGYTVSTQVSPNPPRPYGSTVSVVLQRDGTPVSGADVCLSVDMVGMPMGNLTSQGQETSTGKYDVAPVFGMKGTWEGRLIVTVDGHPVLSKPMPFVVH